MPGFYTANICIAYYALKRQENNGSYLFTLPISGATVVPLSNTVHDYGLYVQAAIEPPTLGAGSEVRAGRLILTRLARNWHKVRKLINSGR
jgi:hypothetical protein